MKLCLIRQKAQPRNRKRNTRKWRKWISDEDGRSDIILLSEADCVTNQRGSLAFAKTQHKLGPRKEPKIRTG